MHAKALLQIPVSEQNEQGVLSKIISEDLSRLAPSTTVLVHQHSALALL